MIKNDREYDLAQEAVADLRRRVAELQQGLNVSRGRVASLRSRLEEMLREIADFDRIRRGDLSMFDGAEDFGRLLIAARIARGLTQRQLADRLGVHESQISRDERT